MSRMATKEELQEMKRQVEMIKRLNKVARRVKARYPKKVNVQELTLSLLIKRGY